MDCFCSDKLFPSFGFGARIPPTYQVNSMPFTRAVITFWVNCSRDRNPLTQTGAFHQKASKLAPVYSKRHLQHDGMPFFPLAPRFMTLLLKHAQGPFIFGRDSSYLRLQAFQVFKFFLHLPFFSFSCLFATVIDLLLGLFPVQKNSEKASSRWANFTME